MWEHFLVDYGEHDTPFSYIIWNPNKNIKAENFKSRGNLLKEEVVFVPQTSLNTSVIKLNKKKFPRKQFL